MVAVSACDRFRMGRAGVKSLIISSSNLHLECWLLQISLPNDSNITGFRYSAAMLANRSPRRIFKMQRFLIARGDGLKIHSLTTLTLTESVSTKPHPEHPAILPGASSTTYIMFMSVKMCAPHNSVIDIPYCTFQERGRLIHNYSRFWTDFETASDVYQFLNKKSVSVSCETYSKENQGSSVHDIRDFCV